MLDIKSCIGFNGSLLYAQYFRMHVSSLTTVSGHAFTQLVNKELQLECIGAISSKNYASTSMDASLQQQSTQPVVHVCITSEKRLTNSPLANSAYMSMYFTHWIGVTLWKPSLENCLLETVYHKNGTMTL